MAKKISVIEIVQKNLMGLKALIGFNVVLNLYMDESDIMMMVSFHKIEKYKDLKPLIVQFIKEDFKEDPVVMNTTISSQVKLYMEGRVEVPKPEEQKKSITKKRE